MSDLTKAPTLSGMYRQVWHVERQQLLPPRLRWCRSFGCKLRGLTFRPRLAPDEGIILVEAGEGRATTAVHMLFVFCDLAIIWVNSAGCIVDTTLAHPWRLAYVPRQPAQYVLETHPIWLEHLQPGDHLQFQII